MALMTLSPESPADADGPWKGEVQLRMWAAWATRRRAGRIRSRRLAGGRAPDFLAGLPTPPRRASHSTLQFRIVPPRKKTSPPPMAAGLLRPPVAPSGRAPILFKDVTAERGIDAGLFYDNWTRGKKPLNHDPRRRAI